MRNRTYTRHILVCMLLLLTTIPGYSWYGDYVKDALTPVGLEEFAGGPNIPFPRLSHSAIDTFSALVNRAAGQQVLDAEFYKNMLYAPKGIILAPSDGNKHSKFNMLVLVEKAGALLYMDAEPSRLETYGGFAFARIGSDQISNEYMSDLGNIVSNYQGDFWVINHFHRSVIRLRHWWDEENGINRFDTKGVFKVEPGFGIADIYFTDMKTETRYDDKLYILCDDPGAQGKIVVLDPYFSDTLTKSTYRVKEYMNVPPDGLFRPKLICGAYNNEPAAMDQDSTVIYTIDKYNRVCMFKDIGVDFYQTAVTRLPHNVYTDYTCLRADEDGSLYLVDKGYGVIFKLDKEFTVLYRFGEEGRNSTFDNIQFNKPEAITVNGNQVFVSEFFSTHSGIQRFHNIAKIIDYRLKDIEHNKYNPLSCVSGKRPFPKVRFNLSEKALVVFSMHADIYDGGPEKNLIDENFVWADTLDTLSAGWHEYPINWDGVLPDGRVADMNGEVIFQITTYRYFPEGDDAEMEFLEIDIIPPKIRGTVYFNSPVSTKKPLELDIPLDEPATGTLYIRNSNGDIVDSVASEPSPEGFEPGSYRRIHFTWQIAGLDSCEPFSCEVRCTDYAGNTNPEPLDLAPFVTKKFANQSGGITKAAFAVTNQRFSPVSTNPTMRHAKIRVTELAAWCPGVSTWYTISLYDTPQLSGTPVFRTEGAANGPFNFDWDGKTTGGKSADDGSYYVSVALRDSAGYSISSDNDPDFNNGTDNKIVKRTFIPAIALTGDDNNRVIDGDGQKSFMASGSQKVHAAVHYTPQAPDDGAVVVEYTNVGNTGTVSTYYDTFTIGSFGSITVPKGAVSNRAGGRYSLRAYYVDDVQNSGRDAHGTNHILQNDTKVYYLTIDNSMPAIAIDPGTTVLTKPEAVTCYLFNNSYHLTEAASYTYDYNLIATGPDSRHETGFVSFPQTSLRHQYTIPSEVVSKEGSYTVKAVLRDNFGRLSDTATAFFYYNERPLEIAVNIGESGVIDGKTYITGSIGDPDITTDDPDHRFDRYILFYKQGANQVPPGSFDQATLEANGWIHTNGTEPGAGLLAPFFRQDITANDFPYSNMSVIPTNLQGYASIAYFNPVGMTPGTYTLMALTYEKNTAIPDWGTAQVNVGEQLTNKMKIETLQVDTSAGGMDIRAAVSGHASIHAVIARYKEGKYTEKVREIHSVMSGTENTVHLKWDYRDTYGNLVPNGYYKVILAAEEIGGNGVDWKFSDNVWVRTEFVVTDISVSPGQIVFPPRPDQPIDESVATVRFKTTKHCRATMTVSYNNTTYATVGPDTFMTGSAVPKTINWNGSGNGNLPYDNATPYSLHLSVRAMDNSSIQKFDTTLHVYRISPAMAVNRPGIPNAKLGFADIDRLYDSRQDNTTEGTADALWITKLNGAKVSDEEVEAGGDMLVDGKQQVSVWKSKSGSNVFSMRVVKKAVELRSVKIRAKVTHYPIEGKNWPLCDYKNDTKTTIDNLEKTIEVKGSFVDTIVLTKSWLGLYNKSNELCNRTFHSSPVIDEVTFYSGAQANNNLGQYFSYSSKCKIDGEYSRCTLFVKIEPSKLNTFQPVKTITNIGSGKYPDHYNAVEFEEAHQSDFPPEVYMTDPVISYNYHIDVLGKGMGVAIEGFKDREDTLAGIISQGRIIKEGVTLSDWNPVSEHYGNILYITGPGINSNNIPMYALLTTETLQGNPLYVKAAATCDADTSLWLHWPFPKDTVPDLTTDNDIHYSRIAYKTSDDNDPRADENLRGGNFKNLLDVYQVSDNTMIDNINAPHLKKHFIYKISATSPNPMDIPVIPNIINPDDYKTPDGKTKLESSTANFILANEQTPEGVSLALTGGGDYLRIAYDPAKLLREPWSSADDPLLTMPPEGYIFGRQAFSSAGFFSESRIPVDVRKTYRSMTGMTSGTGSLDAPSTWNYSFWRNNNGFMVRNGALSYTGRGEKPLYESLNETQQHIGIYSVDGNENHELQMAWLDEEADQFALKHAPLCTPKRFVEIRGTVTYDDLPYNNFTLDYYDVKNKRWNPYNTIETTTADSITRTLGFWDITHCNGDYVLKLEVRRNDSVATVLYPVAIGKNVYKEQDTTQTVYSPYSKAQVLFPENAKHAGVVTVTPVKPAEIPGINATTIPLGPVVEVQPSGLLFEHPRPQLALNLTYDDVVAMGVPLNHLGLIHMYYVDEERGEVAALETGTTKFLVRPQESIPITQEHVSHVAMTPSDTFRIVSELEHTSLYGIFNSAGNFSISPPPKVVNKPFIPVLEGTGPANELIQVYISTDSIFHGDEITWGAYTDDNGNWQFIEIPLEHEGKNYLFVTTNVHGQTKVLQTIVTYDGTAPQIDGDFEPVYASAERGFVYSFAVTSNEPGSVLSTLLGTRNAAAGEYILEQTGENVFGTWVPISGSGLTDYRTIVSVRGVDEAGNVSEPRFKDVVLDNTAPTIAKPVARLRTGGSLCFDYSVTLFDNEKLANIGWVVLTSNGTVIHNGAQKEINGKSYNYTTDFCISREFQAQRCMVEVTVSDAAGNVVRHSTPLDFQQNETYTVWKYSSEIAIRNDIIDNPVTDFPLLIRLDASNFTFSEADPEGSDIRFTDADGNKLYYQIERWDHAKNRAEVWVRIPEIDPFTSQPYIIMYWGNPDAAAPQTAWMTWPDWYRAVYHCSDSSESNETIQWSFRETFDGTASLQDRGFGAADGWILESGKGVVKADHDSKAKLRSPTFTHNSPEFEARWSLMFPSAPDSINDWSRYNTMLVEVVDNDGSRGFSMNYKPLWSGNRDSGTNDIILSRFGDGLPDVLLSESTGIAPANGSKAEWVHFGLSIDSTTAALSIWWEGTKQYRTYTASIDPGSVPQGYANVRSIHFTGTASNGTRYPVLVDNLSVGRYVRGMACSGSGFNEDFTGIAPLSSRGFDAGKDWVLDSANAMMKSVHEGWSKINGPSINIPSNDFSASWALKFPTVPNAGNNWMELNKVYLSFTDAQERNGFTVQFKPLWWANKNPKPDGDMVLKAIIDENSTKIINQHTRIAPENGDKAEWIKLNLTVKNGVAALSAHFTATNQKRTYTAPINIPEDVRLTKLFVMHRTGERDKERCFPVLIDYMRIEGCEPDGEQERLRIADATMYGNHGKGFGVTSSNSLIASGLYFDGSGNYVDGGAFEGIRNPETFTLSAWLKRAGGPKEKVIISKQDDGNGWRMGVDKKHHGCFITHQDTMANETALDQLKQWYHIAATYNGTAASLFIDGAPVRSEPVVVRHAKELPVYIGKWMNGDFYRGMLDEIRVLNTALSGSAIRLDYETQKIDQRIAQPPPIAPQAVRAKYGEEKDVIISWKLHGTYIDSTEIQRTENDSIWQTIAVFLPPRKSFRDTNIVCGSTYGYRVRHWFGTNASPWSVQQEVNVPRCGTPRDLVSITTTAVNSNDKPLNRKKAPVVVNLYDHPTSGKILYTETCTTSVRKGYITILLGLNRDIRKAVETHTVLYAALEIDGFTQEKRVPLTAEGITVITDDYRLSGKGSPGKKAAPVGALYVDIKTNELYVKYGEGGKAWGKITPLP